MGRQAKAKRDRRAERQRTTPEPSNSADPRDTELAKLRAENEQLRRDLERRNMWAAASDTRASPINREIERLQIERDRYKADIEGSDGNIIEFLAEALDYYHRWEAKFSQHEALLKDTVEVYGATGLAAVLYEAANEVIQINQIAFANAVEGTVKEFGLENVPPEILYNPRVFPSFSLELALKYISGASLMEFGAKFSSKAYELAHDPRFLCDQILRECAENGEPSATTLQWLSDEWINKNLSPPPKRDTLLEALKAIQAEKNSGHSRKAFCGKNGIGTRTMRKYQKWWDAIETSARQLSRPASGEQ